MELTVLQLGVLGIVASAVTQGLRLLANRFGYKPNEVVTNIGLWILSIPIAIGFFGMPELPTGSDPAEVANALAIAATTVLGSASLIYNVFMKRVVRSAK